MKKTPLIVKLIILFVLQALPVPFSVISRIGTAVSLANIDMTDSILEAVKRLQIIIISIKQNHYNCM